MVEAPVAAERTTDRRLLAVVVAVVVVSAGIFGGWYVLQQSTSKSTGPSTLDDGPTFYQALASLNSSVGIDSGGPWQLFSVVGIASQVHFSPNVISYYTINASVVPNYCQAALSGLSMFNGTLPLFTGTFNSGTAPFWQFAYFSNATKEILIGTDMLGTTRLAGPLPQTNACALAWNGFVENPSQWLGQIYSNSSLPVNSPEAARVAWTNLGTGFADRWVADNSPLAEMYELGPAMLARTFAAPPGGNWNIDFLGCGLAGFSGDRGLSYAGVTRDGQYAGDFNGSENCALMSSGNPPGVPNWYYSLRFSSPSEMTTLGTVRVTIPYQVDATYPNGTLQWTDVWGLANWMASLNLTSSFGQVLPLVSSGCPNWVLTTAECVANQSGWYAVLLSQGGEWLASYGMTPKGPGWSIPVTAMVSHQQLVIVAPSSWNVTGDVVNVTSTFSNSTIGGSISL